MDNLDAILQTATTIARQSGEIVCQGGQLVLNFFVPDVEMIAAWQSKLAAELGLLEPLRRFASQKPTWGTCAGLVFLTVSWTDRVDIKVAALGLGVEVLARLEDGRIVAVRQGRLMDTAFHPKLSDRWPLSPLVFRGRLNIASSDRLCGYGNRPAICAAHQAKRRCNRRARPLRRINPAKNNGYSGDFSLRGR